MHGKKKKSSDLYQNSNALIIEQLNDDEKSLSYTTAGALRGDPAEGGGAYLLANSAVGGAAPSYHSDHESSNLINNIQDDINKNIRDNIDEQIVTPDSLKDSYRFVRQIGHGSQANVFLAVRLSDGKRVAIKQLNIESVKNWKEYDLFHREARLLGKLKIRGVATLRGMLEPKVDKRLSNIKVLINRFARYKNNQFEKASDKVKSYSKKMKSICEKLNHVQTISDIGNMDIWQALPEYTPRVIPDGCLSFTNDNSESYMKYYNNSSFWGGLCFFSIVISLALLCLDSFPDVSSVLMKYSILFFLALFAVSFLILEIFFNYKNKNYFVGMNYNVLWNILKNGRKTIAVITDVKYIPVSNTVNPKKGLYVCQQMPRFNIRYKFNPPDDSKGDVELVHSCIVYHAPEDNYKVDDPLPILYSLENTYFKETISSVPFPFPVKGFNIDEMVTVKINRLN